MSTSSTFLRKCTSNLLSAPSFVVFSYLDLLDLVFCVIFKHLDRFFEGKASPCYCTIKKISDHQINGNCCHDGKIEMSETLHGRKKKLKQLIALLQFVDKLLSNQNKSSVKAAGGFRFRNQNKAGIYSLGHRWSDCGCDSCISWMKLKNDDLKLHVVVETSSSTSPAEVTNDSKVNVNPKENVIFIHGILSSSLFWTKTLFPKLSKSKKSNPCSLFAVDLLGYGNSPKPRDSLYTLNEHVEWIEKSVISPFELNSFHIVAHSMGTIIALALAAKHSKSVKSITLVAPPYFPSEDGVEFTVMNRLTPKKLWPPDAFLSSLMTWYEHLGRWVCFLVCRNHSTWETLIKRLTGLRDVNFMFLDLMKHTHHSGWHTTHNVLYRGVKMMDQNLETLMQSRTKVHVIMGTNDKSVPPECSYNIKKKFPSVEVKSVANAGHRSVVFRREKILAENLVQIWENAAADDAC